MIQQIQLLFGRTLRILRQRTVALGLKNEGHFLLETLTETPKAMPPDVKAPAPTPALEPKPPAPPKPLTPEGIAKELKPELREALAKNPLAADALTLCKSPCTPEFATPSQVARIERLLTDAEKRGLQIDKTRQREYFHRPTDEVGLTQAIDDFEQAMRKATPSAATSKGDAIMDEAELLQQPGIRKSLEIRLAAREGREFDVLEGQKYPHNQVPIRDKGGKDRRLDSYDLQKQEIISRKSLATHNGQIAFAS